MKQIKSYETALLAHLEAQKDHLASGHRLRQTAQALRDARRELWNLEHDVLQDQELSTTTASKSKV